MNLSSNRPCLNRSRLADGRVDCVGAIDERNAIEPCEKQTMLAYHFKCPSSTTCIPYWNHCLGERCEEHSDDQVWCNLRQESDGCIVNFDSIRCRNGTCVEKGRCNKVKGYELVEDEYMCEYQSILKLTTVPYRKDKESSTKT